MAKYLKSLLYKLWPPYSSQAEEKDHQVVIKQDKRAPQGDTRAIGAMAVSIPLQYLPYQVIPQRGQAVAHSTPIGEGIGGLSFSRHGTKPSRTQTPALTQTRTSVPEVSAVKKEASENTGAEMAKNRPSVKTDDDKVQRRRKTDKLDTRMRQGNDGGPGNSRDFLVATLDLFGRQRAGHMPSFAYSSPQYPGDPVRGNEIWPKMARSPDYYLFWDDIKLLEESSDDIVSLIGPEVKNISLVELGPGEDDIVERKTFSLLKAFHKAARKVSDYIAMDVNADYAKGAARKIGENFDVREDYIVSDFRRENLQLQTSGTPVMVIFGGTLFNMPKIKEAGPHQILQTYLSYIREMIGEGGYIVITQDVNTDEKSLLQAYDDAGGYGKLTAHCVMHRMNRDLKTTNFSADDFEIKMRWEAKEQRVSINAVAVRDKVFGIGDERFSMDEGDEWSLINAYKMSAENFKKNAEFAGFDYVGTVPERKNGRIVAHVLKAV